MATFAPLSPEFGASQIAINLASALRDRGHSVTLWSPEPKPASIRWIWFIPWARRQLEQAIAEGGPFEVVDVPPVMITHRVARSAPLVIARSVQPDLRYLACEIAEAGRKMLRQPLRSAVIIGYNLYLSALVITGWHRAQVVLCLGYHEEAWMKRWFPWLTPKIARYFAAPAPEDRERFKCVRQLRTDPSGPGIRFLWIGRWVPHKGTRRLLAFIQARVHTHPHDTFTIAGCGDRARSEIPAELVKCGRVRIIPAFSRDELVDLLMTHDAGLFTSTVEGWGLCLHEMLESGMPVYATEAGAVPELRPWFPDLLFNFPPSANEGSPAPAKISLDRVYEEKFSWNTVAEVYEGICLKLCRE